MIKEEHVQKLNVQDLEVFCMGIMAENASAREQRIRKRVSYCAFVELIALLMGKPALEQLVTWFHNKLDKRQVYGSETNAFYAHESLKQFCRDFKVKARMKVSGKRAVAVSQICNECGRSVAFGSGWFVNRVPDINSYKERLNNGKPYPRGDFVCAECDLKHSEEEI